MKRFTALIAVLLTAVMVLTGCSAKNGMGDSSSSMAASPSAQGAAQDAALSYDGMAGETASAAGNEDLWKNNDAKIIRTVDMEVETTDFDAFISGVRQSAAEAGGYVQNSSVSGGRMHEDGSQDLRYGSLTLRVPKEKVDGVISGVTEKSNVTYQNEYAEDISLTYYDTESRKKALEIEQERLLSLLEKADDIEAIIRLEERLTEVRRQLEGYTSSLKQYDNMVDYSTLNIQINEVKSVTEKQSDGFLSQMGQGIAKSFKNLGVMGKNFVLFLIVNLPYILLIAVAAAVVIFLLRRRHKRTKAARISSESGPKPETASEKEEKKS